MLRCLIISYLIALPLVSWSAEKQPLQQPKSWMLERIHKDLKAYQMGIKIQAVKSSYDAITKGFDGDRAPIAYIKFSAGATDCSVPSKITKNMKGRLKHFIATLKALNELSALPPFEALVSLDETCERPYYLHLSKVPIFSICKSEKNTSVILFPRRVFENNDDEQTAKMAAYAKKCSWHARKPMIAWRMLTFDRPNIAYDWRLGPTYPLLFLAKKHPDLLDFGIPHQCRQMIGGRTSSFNAKQGFYVVDLTLEDHLSYRYLLSFDQKALPRNIEWQMLSGCALIVPKTSYIAWFSSQLRPDYHYLVIDQQCVGLVEKYVWCQKNPDKVAQIAKNCQTFANECFTQDNVMSYFNALICRYAKLLQEENP